FNVPIRTVTFAERSLGCGIGSGIVADSDAAAEVAEWRAKARFLGAEPLRALETMLAVDGRIQREEAHLARLATCCADLALALDRAGVRAALQRATPASGRHRIRLVAGGGPPLIAVTPAPAP